MRRFPNVLRYALLVFCCCSLGSVFSFARSAASAGESIQIAAAKDPKKNEPKGNDKKADEKKPDEKKPAEVKLPPEYQDALKAIEKKDWKKAADLLKKAIAKDPTPKNQYYPQFYLGLASVYLGDFETARKSCTPSSKAPDADIKNCLALIEKLAPKTQPTKESPSPKTADAPAAAEPTQPPVAQPVLTEATPTPQPAKPQSTPAPSKSAPTISEEKPTPQIAEPTKESAAIKQTRGTDGALPEEDVPASVGKTYAVIIGLGDFQDKRIPALRYTVNDAQGMFDVLTDPNYGGVPKENVTLLLNEDATSENIKRAIGTWLKQQATQDDTVLIYFAGHGAPEGEETYWVTYNADIDDLYATALSNKDIADMLNRVESKRVITLLDSCYSAATVNRTNRTRATSVQIPWDQFSGEGRVAITASDGSQLSLEMQEFEHGVFTYYVLEGLKGKADGLAGEERDGMIEVEELWNYVRNNVTDTAKKQGNKQTPVFQGALTSGIPLTYDLTYLQELKERRQQEIQAKQAKLKTLFEKKQISAQHFDCAFRMLEEGKSDGYLDGLLADELSPETFGKLFQCPL